MPLHKFGTGKILDEGDDRFDDEDRQALARENARADRPAPSPSGGQRPTDDLDED